MVVLGPGGDVAVDVDEFMAAARRPRDPEWPEAAFARRCARRRALPEDLYEDWATPHREQLANRRARLLVQLASALVEQGSAGEAVLACEPLAAERPDDEEIHRALLRALFGVVAAAMPPECSTGFVTPWRSYGAAPSRAMADMYRRLSTGSGVGRAVVANNLPRRRPASLAGPRTAGLDRPLFTVLAW